MSGAAVVALLAATLVAVAAAPVRADDNNPAPPPEGGGGANACTEQQLEGGYEDVGGRCQLTGWNWDFGNPCIYDAEVGRLGDTSACTTDGCITAMCEGGGPTGPSGGDDDPGEWPPEFEDFEEFDDWCVGQGGEVEVNDPVLPDGTLANLERHSCILDGQEFASCQSGLRFEPDLELTMVCLISDPPEPNEFPGPTTTQPGPLARLPRDDEDVAAPVDPGAEPRGPIGPVVTVEFDSDAVFSEVAAPVGSDDDEPGESPTPAPTTTSGGFDMLDFLVVSGEVTDDEG